MQRSVSADFTEVTQTERYRLNASIPVARDVGDDPGAADQGAADPSAAPASAQDGAQGGAQDGGPTMDGVPDAVAVGPEDATADVDPTMIDADAVASQLGYTTSATQEQGDPTDKTEFGFTWGNHVRVADGGKIHHDTASSTWQVSVTYDNPVKFRVYTSIGPNNQKDIDGPNDTDITKTNFPKVVTDLTPGSDGRPPRTQFWARDLTIAHEQFHVVDGQGLCRQAVSSEQSKLNQQQAASMDDVQALLRPIPMRIINARGAGMANGGEDRAYAAGKAAYQSRADAVKANGQANKYTMADGGDPGSAVASNDTSETGGSSPADSGTAPA